jgi:hypothetical protein
MGSKKRPVVVLGKHDRQIRVRGMWGIYPNMATGAVLLARWLNGANGSLATRH